MTSPDRRHVTPDRIARAALAIIDTEGTAAVTMRRVAGELGVRAPSLYAHVSGRAEILRLAHAEVSREIGPMPDTGSWRVDLRTFFTRMHAVLLRHGDVAALQFGIVADDADSLRAFEGALTSLAAAGLPPSLASQAIERLSLYVTSDAYEQWVFARNGPPDPTALTERMRTEAPGLERLLGGRLPHHTDHVSAFTFGLDLLLGGLAALADATPGAGPRDDDPERLGSHA